MTRRTILLTTALVVCLAASFILWGMHYQARLQLRGQSDSLREQFKRLGQLEADNIRLSNIVVQANTPLSEVQLAELQRLREQIELLRRQTNQVQTLRAEIARLRTALSTARNS